MSKRVGFNVLVQKLRQKSKLSVVASILLSVFLTLFSIKIPVFADGPADSVQIYDIKTNVVSATKYKKVKIEGFIGAATGGGTDYSLAYDEIQVISEDAGGSGYNSLSVSEYTIVTKEGDPQNAWITDYELGVAPGFCL